MYYVNQGEKYFKEKGYRFNLKYDNIFNQI